MTNLKLKVLVLGVFQTNCYIISNADTKEAIVIDPADNQEKIEEYLKANDLVCKAILLTHGHFDHILAAESLKGITATNIYAHEDEVELLKDPNLNSSARVRRECTLVPDILLKDQEMLELAGFKIRVIHTPGHTSGGTCYYFLGHAILISGDTLFLESVGRSDLPTGDGKLLIKSLLDKIMTLEDGVKVYPGHGEATTIGYERDHNIYLAHNPFY